MHGNPIKICPKCGAEYTVDALICADCDVQLVLAQEGDKKPIVPITEDEELVCIREDQVNYLREVSEHINQAGLPTFIRFLHEVPKRGPAGSVYGLFVRPDDAEAAKEIVRVHWLQGAPEDAASYEYKEQELAGVCPACSTPVPEESAECPNCGLVVKAREEIIGPGDEEEVDGYVCPSCGTEVDEDATKCPNCRAEFE
jgi:ribosomal protein L40E